MSEKKSWWREAVIYEIYCKSFKDSDGDGIGDIPGIIEKLPYLKELGITCIWLTPIYPSPQVDNGYDVADYYGIEPVYGGLPAFKELIQKAHSMGIRIIMDMVLNHSSDECRWFQESRKSKDNPYRDFYIWRDPKPDGSEPNNWANGFNDGNGSAWQFDERTGQYYLHNYAVKMPELNWESEGLKKEVYAMMRYWLDMGVDGFRLDVITKLKKPAGLPDSPLPLNSFGYAPCKKMCSCIPGVTDIIHDLNVNTWGRPEFDAFAVGEAGGVTSRNAEEFLDPRKKILDALYHFEIVSRNRPKVTLTEYKKIQSGWASLMEKGIWPVQHLSNHDQPRQVSRFGDDGEFRVRSAKLLGILTHMMPGTPFIYQGEEIGMVNTYFDRIEDYDDRYTVGDYRERRNAGLSHEEALFPLRARSRDNARTPMLWNSSKNAGFTDAAPWIKCNPGYKELNVEKDMASPDSVFRFYQQLIHMRKARPAVLNGDFRLYLPEDEQIVMFTRSCTEETLLIIANASGATADVTLSEAISGKKDGLSASGAEDVLSSTGDSRSSSEGTYLPWEAHVYVLNGPG